MAKTLTAHAAAGAIKKFAKLAKQRTLVPFRKALSAGRKDAIQGYRNTGIGRSIWRSRHRKSGVPPLILKRNTARFSRSHKGFIGGYTAKGMAALIESGGKTSPHIIRPKKAAAIVFDGRAGTVFLRRPVMHPGGPVKKFTALENAMEKVADKIVPTLDGVYAQLSRLLL